jgi:uncharacterized membrane protein
MITMTASQQKFLKAIHLMATGLWLSCIIVLALLPVVSGKIKSGDELYMYNLAYHFIDMFILTPAAVLTLCTGLVYSLLTKWGFFQHGWLVYKWIVTVLIIITGTFYLGPMVTKLLKISDIERIAALQNQYYLKGEFTGFCAAIINSSLLIIAVFFSIYKPWKNIKK